MAKMLYLLATHIIFDFDGLLIDSERIYDEINHKIAAKYGKKFTNEIREKLLGTNEQISSRLAVELMKLPISVEEYTATVKQMEGTELANVPLMPGAEKLLRHLHKHKVPFAMATSSSQHSVDFKLQNYPEISSMFSHKICGSSNPDVKRSKPFPDIFQVAAVGFNDKPPPEKCLVFEDSPNGVKAAIAAGMQVVMVPAPETKNTENATLVLKSLEDFNPEIFGLPAFEN